MAVSGACLSKEETPARNKKRSSILGSLREAINKVRFLLSFSATRWMLLTSVGARRRGTTPRRGLSFDSRPGLLDVEGGIASSPASSRTTSRSASMGTASTSSRASSAAASPEAASSRGGSPAASLGGDSDVDHRADLFIANFRRHLAMERQVSLQLRYVRGNSWDRTP